MSFSITIHLYCYSDSVLYCLAPPSCTWKYVLLENWFHSIASEQFFQFTFQIELKLKILFFFFFFFASSMLFISISFFRYFGMQFFSLFIRIHSSNPFIVGTITTDSSHGKCEDEAAYRKKRMFLEPILNAFLDFLFHACKKLS